MSTTISNFITNPCSIFVVGTLPTVTKRTSIRYSPFCAFNTETNAWDIFAFYYVLCLHCTSFQSSMPTKCPCQTGVQCNVSIFEMGHSSFRCPFRHSIQTATPSNARKVPRSIVPPISPFLLTAAIYSYFL